MAKYNARTGIIAGVAALALAGCAAPSLEMRDYSKFGVAKEQVLRQRQECYVQVDGVKYQAKIDEAYRKRRERRIGAAISSPFAVLAPQPYAAAVMASEEKAKKAEEENQKGLDERMRDCMKEKGFEPN
ncbi:hypothetical protein HYU09_03320 [Candidatus Woesearchaeota archaeon]|nr:hypothetical protein [Candidatus Woesearchaeota archaeon]